MLAIIHAIGLGNLIVAAVVGFVALRLLGGGIVGAGLAAGADVATHGGVDMTRLRDDSWYHDHEVWDRELLDPHTTDRETWGYDTRDPDAS